MAPNGPRSSVPAISRSHMVELSTKSSAWRKPPATTGSRLQEQVACEYPAPTTKAALVGHAGQGHASKRWISSPVRMMCGSRSGVGASALRGWSLSSARLCHCWASSAHLRSAERRLSDRHHAGGLGRHQPVARQHRLRARARRLAAICDKNSSCRCRNMHRRRSRPSPSCSICGRWPCNGATLPDVARLNTLLDTLGLVALAGVLFAVRAYLASIAAVAGSGRISRLDGHLAPLGPSSAW